METRGDTRAHWTIIVQYINLQKFPSIGWEILRILAVRPTTYMTHYTDKILCKQSVIGGKVY